MKQGQRRKKVLVIILSIFIIILIGALAYYNYYKTAKEVVERDVIYEGIQIQGIDVGGLTKEEAIVLLSNRLSKDDEEHKIVLTHGEQNWVLNFKDWGFENNFEEIVQQAYSYGKQGEMWDRYKLIQELKEEKRSYHLEYTYQEEMIDKILEHIKNNFTIPSKNATIQRKNNAFLIEKEVIGHELDMETNRAEIKKLLDSRQSGQVELVLLDYVPKITESYLAQIQDLMGGYRTKFIQDGSGRAINLEVASSKLNGALVLPGEVLSIMGSIGPADLEHGYKNAPIILNGKLVPGVGGGICQIATTAYNAVLNSELEVMERRNHSLPVAYVPLGMDAAVSGEVLDFKFKNNTEFPLYVESYANNNYLGVNIYGKEQRLANRTIDFTHVTTEVIMPPPDKVVGEDENLLVGEKTFKLKPLKGFKVKLYKNIYVDGKFQERELINHSYYRPRAGEIIVGTKPLEDTNKFEEANSSEQETDGLPIESGNGGQEEG